MLSYQQVKCLVSALDVNGNSSNKLFERRGCNQFDSRGMSRRFSNLQYISIGILFGTCVFLWTRKLNLTKTLDESDAASNLRQTARNKNEEHLINSWTEKIEAEDVPSNFEDSEDAINGPEDNANDHLSSKEAGVDEKEVFVVNSRKGSEETEQAAPIDSSNTSPDEPAVDLTASPEPEDANASDAPIPAIENNEDSSSTSVGTSDALSWPISTTIRTK